MKKKIKANLIIGKKQVVLAALVLLLSGAVYINYVYSNGEEGYLATNLPGSGVQEKESESNEDTGKNYGDAQLVSGQVSGGAEYFQKAALEKTRSRDEAIETVKSVLQDSKASAEEVAKASAQIVQITKQIEDESKMESLIKAKGFSECVVYLDEQTANVIVKTEGLKVEEAAQIKNIIVSQKEIKSENISIQEVK